MKNVLGVGDNSLLNNNYAQFGSTAARMAGCLGAAGKIDVLNMAQTPTAKTRLVSKKRNKHVSIALKTDPFLATNVTSAAMSV